MSGVFIPIDLYEKRGRSKSDELFIIADPSDFEHGLRTRTSNTRKTLAESNGWRSGTDRCRTECHGGVP